MPVAATRVGAIPELERRHGPLVAPLDIAPSPEALARAVECALTSAFGTAVIPRAREIVAQYYTSGTLKPVCVPMFAGFIDFMILRTSLLRAILADLQVLEQIWHEIALPTAILHHTDRIGRAEGIALWGDDRKRSLNELMSSLHGVDWLHPVKLSMSSNAEIIKVYSSVMPFAVEDRL